MLGGHPRFLGNITLPFSFFRKACGRWAVWWSGLDVIFLKLPLVADALGDARLDGVPTVDAMQLLGHTMDRDHVIVCTGLWNTDPRNRWEAERSPNLPDCYGCLPTLPEEEQRVVWVIASPYSYGPSPQAKDLWIGPPDPDGHNPREDPWFLRF